MKNTKEVKIGDTVTLTPTGQKVKILDIFTRDGVKLLEVQVGEGRTTPQRRNGSELKTMNENLRKIWNDTCLAAGIDSISMSHAATTAAMLLVHGNHEAFTHNTKLVADLQYIQQRYNINGGGTADPDFAEELKAKVKELEDYEREHGLKAVPKETKEYFKRMYNVEF